MSEEPENQQMVRIEMDEASIEAMIRSASIEELRSDSTELERRHARSRGATALDALCGLSDRQGTGAGWDVLCELDRAQLLSFATFAISEMAQHTEYRWADRPDD